MSLSSLKSSLKSIAANTLHLGGHFKRRASEDGAWRILMYHRINQPDLLGHQMQPGMYVRPESFEMQMRFLKENYNVVRLQELSEKIGKGEKVTPGTIAITFDDGWLDNYTEAFPTLRKYELPATIFLATKYINSTETFWSDGIPYAIARLRENGVRTLKLSGDFSAELLQATEAVLTSSPQELSLIHI